jgi:hypothetical protein
MNPTLYLTPDNARYFLIPGGESLPAGDFVIRAFAGDTRKGRPFALLRAVLSLLQKRMARR